MASGPKISGPPDDLPRLPLTTREELQALPLSDRLARGADPERLITRHTSGTSGRPMVLYRTWTEARIAMAIRLRALHDLGARPADRRANIVVERQTPHPRNRRRPQRALMALGVFPKIDLEMREGLPAILGALCRWRPDLLLGYPSVLARLAGLLTGVIPLAAPSTEDLNRIRNTASDVLGPGTGLEIQLVDHIESEACGKFRVSRALPAGEAESWTPPGARA